ncbi:hypothetical protein BpHYR1_030821 [Brachionus plicatilis]|uniref:Uncharacterized protein n=1 Tax=Brachionus plicatilis TaxID=10195 RepID=A0A3M7R8R7_BRAPC|nr:hypothetical protein BpHYR1_030821 [Brachionus plicatilis]
MGKFAKRETCEETSPKTLKKELDALHDSSMARVTNEKNTITPNSKFRNPINDVGMTTGNTRENLDRECKMETSYYEIRQYTEIKN